MMASRERRYWRPTFTAGLSRRERQGCEYDAYLPDAVSGRNWSLDGDVAAEVAEAEAAIARMNLQATALRDSEALARLILRTEAVASSRIEGLTVGARRLLRAEVARVLGEEHFDVSAEEVLANIRAMREAMDATAHGEPITVDALLGIHRELLAGTRYEAHGGVIREAQNWIGGSVFNPCGAAFVPPPPELVLGLLEDLCAFCNEDSLPAVAQAAIAHAQFETIHPFADGNGRTGRVLIHVVLRRRGLISQLVPPLSLILATRSADYIAALTGTRYEGGADSQLARKGANDWIAMFAASCSAAVADVTSYQAQLAGLQARWRSSLRVRSGSAADLLLAALPSIPAFTVASASERIGRSFQATNEAVGRLQRAGVIRLVSIGRRNRAFEAPELIDTFGRFERETALPS